MWKATETLFGISMLLTSVVASAASMPQGVSALRLPDETFEQARSRSAINSQSGQPSEPWELTAMSEAGPLETLNRRLVPAWRESQDGSLLPEAFSVIRNHHTLRSAWDQAYDGCFARAAVASQVIEDFGLRRPAKVFIFGELSLRTRDQGVMSWWYHVAPAVWKDGTVYILDPAVDREKPLPLSKWVSRLTDDPDSVELSVCNTFAYNPWSPCYISGPEAEDRAQADLMAFTSE